MDRPCLAVGATGADHEVVGVADHPAEVELDDVERLAIRGELGDRGRHLLGGDRGLFRTHHSPWALRPWRVVRSTTRLLPSAYRWLAFDVVRYPVGDQVPNWLTGPDPAADHRRRDPDAGHLEETGAPTAVELVER